IRSSIFPTFPYTTLFRSDVRVCFLDELAHSAEGFPAPVPEFGDSFRDELRCRLALARARLFHVLILGRARIRRRVHAARRTRKRSEEHTSELQSPDHLVC